jgi:hypothetical protein
LADTTSNEDEKGILNSKRQNPESLLKRLASLNILWLNQVTLLAWIAARFRYPQTNIASEASQRA